MQDRDPVGLRFHVSFLHFVFKPVIFYCVWWEGDLQQTNQHFSKCHTLNISILRDTMLIFEFTFFI